MKLTDKPLGIINHLYMRIYDTYLKKKDPARFTACLYVGLLIGLLFSPIPIFCAELFRMEEKNIDAIILLLYAMSILIWTFGRFNKKRIQQLKTVQVNQRSKYTFPKWLLFSLLPAVFIWFVLMNWLMMHYVIQPYQLEGILVK